MVPARQLIVSAAWLFLVGCADKIDAPFPASFTLTGPGEFEAVIYGTSEYPANTVAGEETRIAWLRDYIAARKICEDDYKIVERSLEQLKQSAKSDLGRQTRRSVTYVGKCISP